MTTNEHAYHDHSNPWVTGAHVTLHCLTGCVTGELAGLLIGVSIGLTAWTTMIIATTLSYISGFALGVMPVMRSAHVNFIAALRMIWIGEAVSIGVMEVVMNGVDYAVGGVQTASVFAPLFWIGLAIAIPAGFLAAWPVNWWLLKRNLRAGH